MNKAKLLASCALAGTLIAAPFTSARAVDPSAPPPDPEKQLIHSYNQHVKVTQQILQRQISGKTAGAFDDGQILKGVYAGGGMAAGNEAAIATAFHDLTIMAKALEKNGGDLKGAVDVVTAYQNNPARAYQEGVGNMRAFDGAVGASAGAETMMFAHSSNHYLGPMNFSNELVQKGPDGKPLFMNIGQGFQNGFETLSGHNASEWKTMMAAAANPTQAIAKFVTAAVDKGGNLKEAYNAVSGADKGIVPRGMNIGMLDDSVAGRNHAQVGLDPAKLAAENKTPLSIALTKINPDGTPERVMMDKFSSPQEMHDRGIDACRIMGIADNATTQGAKFYDAKMGYAIPIDGAGKADTYVVMGPAPEDKGVSQTSVGKITGKLIDNFSWVMTEDRGQANKIMEWGEKTSAQNEALYNKLQQEGKIVYFGAPAGAKGLASTEMSSEKINAQMKATYENIVEKYGIPALQNMGLAKDNLGARPHPPAAWDAPAKYGQDQWYDKVMKGGTPEEKALLDRYGLSKDKGNPAAETSQTTPPGDAQRRHGYNQMRLEAAHKAPAEAPSEGESQKKVAENAAKPRPFVAQMGL